MRHKSNQIGITGENPERNLCFYDLEDRNRIARIYGGYNRAIDCWLMNSDESLVLTVYKCKDKDKNGGNKANNAGLIVAQRVENCLDPN